MWSLEGMTQKINLKKSMYFHVLKILNIAFLSLLKFFSSHKKQLLLIYFLDPSSLLLPRQNKTTLSNYNESPQHHKDVKRGCDITCQAKHKNV